MAQHLRAWGGSEWEDRVKLWLSIRYLENWVPIPDTDGGDFGIEGFSRTGNVYQCYAAEGPLSVSQLYEKQRDKMTKDLSKFCENRDDFEKIFGTTKIKRWILAVPKHQSAKLNQHATQKSMEVRNVGLCYVDSTDFQVHIQTEDDFLVEESIVLQKGAAQLALPLTDVKPEEVKSFRDLPANNLLIKNLNLKVPKLIKKGSQKSKVSDAIILSFIRGRNLLEHLRRYPDFWERVDRIKRDREQLLELPSLMTSQSPPELFTQTIRDFAGELQSQVPVLSSSHADALAQEAVSDWVLRCPLQFPD